jgi:hypothetical protein
MADDNCTNAEYSTDSAFDDGFLGKAFVGWDGGNDDDFHRFRFH